MKYHIAAVGTVFDEYHYEKLRKCAADNGCTIDIYATPEEAAAHVEHAQIIFASATAKGDMLARAAKELKWFSSFSAGVDRLLKPGVLAEDVVVTNGSGAYGLTIAEHLIMVTLMLLRRYPEYDELVRNKVFKGDLRIRSIYDATITICGTGDIGTSYAKRLRAFGPKKIIGVNRSGGKAEGYDEIVTIKHLDEILPETDVLALMLPGTPETDGLFSRERLGLLRKDAYIINVGRGNCIDQEALIEALREDRLAGAAIDVFKQEPVPADDPIWTAKNLLFTPHSSGKTTLKYTRDKLVDIFCDNLNRFCTGKELTHVVDKKLGY